MNSPYFFAGREAELRALIHPSGRTSLDRQLSSAACRGLDPETFHPAVDRPEPADVDRCASCTARLACLAIALRAEDPEMRTGWYGGLGPEDRDNVARALGLDNPNPPAPDRAIQAARLQADGWTVDAIAAELGCSRRTVQRYLRAATA